MSNAEHLTPGPEEKETSASKEIQVGSEVVVTFRYGRQPRTGQRNLISKETGRKHILPNMVGEQPLEGIQYKTTIVDDTQPFNPHGGAFIAEILEPTEWGKIQLKMKVDGYAFMMPYDKVSQARKPLSSGDIKRSLELTYSHGKWDLIVLDFTGTEEGGFDNARYGVWGRRKPITEETKEVGKQTIPLAEPEEPLFKEVKEMMIPPIEIMPGAKTVRVLDIEVEKNPKPGKLVPPPEKFKFYTLDQKTMGIVYRVASAYSRRSPLFLEGDTATSKTSGAEFFASIIGAEVRRLNLSGQTDTTELIGKFVPNDGSKQIEFENRIRGWDGEDEKEREEAYQHLHPESVAVLKKIYSKIKEEGKARTLTRDESAQISYNEDLNIFESQWVWQDGIIPQAMKKGQIVILDEATLAEPQIVERINSVLEEPPSLVLSENGGILIGPNGEYEVHPNFWIVGTGNPAGMAGRRAFSEAFLRRWRDFYRAETPTENEYEEMLRFMVFGEQPTLEFENITYKGPGQAETPYSFLADVPGIDKFLMSLALFHKDMINLAEPAVMTIGKSRHRMGGKYIFTRETLLSVMQFLAQEKVLDVVATKQKDEPVYLEDWRVRAEKALQRYYLDPVLEEDRRIIKDAMQKYPVAEVLGEN